MAVPEAAAEVAEDVKKGGGGCISYRAPAWPRREQGEEDAAAATTSTLDLSRSASADLIRSASAIPFEEYKIAATDRPRTSSPAIMDPTALQHLQTLAQQHALDIAGAKICRTSSRFCLGVEHGDYNGTNLFGVGTDRYIGSLQGQQHKHHQTGLGQLPGRRPHRLRERFSDAAAAAHGAAVQVLAPLPARRRLRAAEGGPPATVGGLRRRRLGQHSGRRHEPVFKRRPWAPCVDGVNAAMASKWRPRRELVASKMASRRAIDARWPQRERERQAHRDKRWTTPRRIATRRSAMRSASPDRHVGST